MGDEDGDPDWLVAFKAPSTATVLLSDSSPENSQDQLHRKKRSMLQTLQVVQMLLHKLIKGTLSKHEEGPSMGGKQDKPPKRLIWVQPEYPKYMRPALGGLKELNLEKIHPTNDFSWLIFHLLGAAPRLQTLHIEVFNHVCHPDWHKKLDIETDTVRMPPLGFRHRRLKEVSIRRAFHVFKDMPLARRILEMAVNLEKLTLGVEDLGCDGCTVTLPRWPALAISRHTFSRASKDVDVLVEKLKHGIATSARIQLL